MSISDTSVSTSKVRFNFHSNINGGGGGGVGGILRTLSIPRTVGIPYLSQQFINMSDRIEMF